MEEERVYVKDYVAEPASRIYKRGKTRRCDGKWLTVDGFGYKLKECSERLKPGGLCYYKAYCQCSNKNELYCSALCCYPYECNRCGRRSCKECYIANANDCCAYCVYLSDDCDCPAYVDGSDVSEHDSLCEFYESRDTSDESSSL